MLKKVNLNGLLSILIIYHSKKIYLHSFKIVFNILLKSLIKFLTISKFINS